MAQRRLPRQPMIGMQAESPMECVAAAPDQPVGSRRGLGRWRCFGCFGRFGPGVRLTRDGRCLHQTEQRLRHLHLGAPAAAREMLDHVQRPVARATVLCGKRGRGEHELHQRAGAADDVGPVGVADLAQRGHRIAHAQVVGRLFHGLLRLHTSQIGQGGLQPVEHLNRHLGVDLERPVLQTLRHLGQEGNGHAAPLQQGPKRLKPLHSAGRQPIAHEVGHLARRLVGGQALGEAAQVLDQHHTQRGRQGPHFAQTQLA